MSIGWCASQYRIPDARRAEPRHRADDHRRAPTWQPTRHRHRDGSWLRVANAPRHRRRNLRSPSGLRVATFVCSTALEVDAGLARRLQFMSPCALGPLPNVFIDAMKTTVRTSAPDQPAKTMGCARSWLYGVAAYPLVDGGLHRCTATGRRAPQANSSNRNDQRENRPAAPAVRRQANEEGESRAKIVATDEFGERVVPVASVDFGMHGSASGGAVTMWCPRHQCRATAPRQDCQVETRSTRWIGARSRTTGGLSRQVAATGCRCEPLARWRGDPYFRSHAGPAALRSMHRSTLCEPNSLMRPRKRPPL